MAGKNHRSSGKSRIITLWERTRMRKYLAVLIFAAAGLSGYANDLKDAKLLGNVKTVASQPYKMVQAFGQWTQVKDTLSNTTTYDTKGNKTEEAGYNVDGLLSPMWEGGPSKMVYAYDAKGNMTERADYLADGSLQSKTVFAYDAKGNMTEDAYRADGSLDSKRVHPVYTVNAKENKTEEPSYTADGSLAFKMVYTHDAKGNMTEMADYLADGSLGFKIVFAYDAKGTATEEARYNADGSLGSKMVFAYDAKGNRTTEANYDADGSLDSKMVYTYEYDPIGNWTKQAISKEVTKFGQTYLEPDSVTIRSITYFQGAPDSAAQDSSATEWWNAKPQSSAPDSLQGSP